MSEVQENAVEKKTLNLSMKRWSVMKQRVVGVETRLQLVQKVEVEAAVVAWRCDEPNNWGQWTGQSGAGGPQGGAAEDSGRCRGTSRKGDGSKPEVHNL